MASHRAFVSSAGLRRDGRRPREVRRLKYQFGVYGDCDGSVYLEHGCNKVLVSVRRPRAYEKRSAAQFDRATVTCTYQLLSFARTEHRRPTCETAGPSRWPCLFVAPLRASFAHLYPAQRLLFQCKCCKRMVERCRLPSMPRRWHCSRPSSRVQISS